MREAIDTDPRVALTSGWSILFADLLALMLSFFILLFSLTPVSDVNWSVMTTALTRQLNGVETPPQVMKAQVLPQDLHLTPRYLSQLLEQGRADNRLLAQGHWQVNGDKLFIFFKKTILFVNGSQDLSQLGAMLARFGNGINVVVGDADREEANALAEKIAQVLLEQQAALKLQTLTSGAANNILALTNYEPDARYKGEEEIAIIVEIRSSDNEKGGKQ